MILVYDLVKEKEPLSENIIKQIHYLVLADKREDRGVYRRVPVRIMGAEQWQTALYITFQEFPVRRLFCCMKRIKIHAMYHIFVL